MEGHNQEQKALRDKIIGLGEKSFRKSYYPELQDKISDLERFKTLLDQSNDAIFLTDVPTGRLLYGSKSACRQICASYDECLSLTMYDIISESGERLKEIFSGKTSSIIIDAMLLKRSGERTPYELNMHLVTFNNRKYVVAIARNITERKQAEEALRKRTTHLAKSQTIAHLGSYDWDLAHDTDEWSDELYHILGIRPGDVKPSLEAFLQFVHPDDRPIIRQHVDDMLNKNIFTGGYEVRIVRPDGSVRWVRIDGENMSDESGKVTRIFGTLMDITESKQAEDEIKSAKAQAELYLDLMGHDITNMNQVLMGNLELIELMQESGKINQALITNSIEMINRSSRMISDVKKLTGLQENKVPLKDVDVCGMLAKVKARYSSVPGRDVTINYAPGEKCLVRAGDLLEDVFDNLVNNAIRHSTGPVTIDVEVDPVTLDRRLYYRVAIVDNGPGIPDDVKTKILITPVEAVKKLERRGFGLYLVRTLVDYYHGKVWVENRVPGDYTKGTRFVVMLPAVDHRRIRKL